MDPVLCRPVHTLITGGPPTKWGWNQEQITSTSLAPGGVGSGTSVSEPERLWAAVASQRLPCGAGMCHLFH